MATSSPAKPKKKRPYGTGGYWKAPNGHYKARFHLQNGVTLCHWTATKAEADKWLDEQLEIVRQGRLPVGGRPATVEPFVERWLTNISTEEARGTSTPPGPGTMDGNRYKIRNYLAKPYGSHRIAELRREHIDVLYLWLRAGQTLPNALGVVPGVKLSRKPLKAPTIRHFHHQLNALFQAAEDEGLVGENPMAKTP